MTTEQALELLSLRLAGTLSAQDAEELDRWLRENPDHELIAEGWQSAHESLQSAFEPRREQATLTGLRVARELPLVEIPTPSQISWPEVSLSPPPPCRIDNCPSTCCSDSFACRTANSPGHHSKWNTLIEFIEFIESGCLEKIGYSMVSDS